MQISLLRKFFFITLINIILTEDEKIYSIPIAGENEYSCFAYVSMKKIGRIKFYITLREDVEKYFGRIIGPEHELRIGFEKEDFGIENGNLNSVNNYKFYPDTLLWSFFNFIPVVNDEHYSLIHSMKNEGLINKNSFSFDFYTGIASPISNLYLGGVPKKLINNTIKYSFDINYQNKKNGWFVKDKVKLIEIKFTNNTYYKYEIKEEDSELQFDVNEWGIICFPKHIFNDLVIFGLGHLFEKKICKKKYSYWNGFKGIICDVTQLDDFPVFNFIIGNKNFSINKDKALYNEGKVLFNECKNNFILGKGLMKNYEAVEFDYDNKQIHFYQDAEKKNLFDVNDNYEVKSNFMKNSIFLIFGFIVFIFWLCFKKGKKVKNHKFNQCENYSEGAFELI